MVRGFHIYFLKKYKFLRLNSKEFNNVSGLWRIKNKNVWTLLEPFCFLLYGVHNTYLYLLRHILHSKKTAFIVEHDFMMSTYLADRVIVFDGVPGRQSFARS